jgi:SAM-dependent methyltransferase
MSNGRPQLFDGAAHALAQARARRIAGERFLDSAAAEGLADRLAPVTRRFAHGLCIGQAVPAQIAPYAEQWTLGGFDADERLAVKGRFDLAVSLFSLQAVNDLPGALAQIHDHLNPDGLFLAALLGGATLRELRESFAAAEIASRGGISPRVSPFADVRDAGALLQRAGFALPVADVERLAVRYGDFFGLVRDLRAHGLTNVMAERSRAFLRRDTLAALASHYAAHHSDADGKLRAQFETIYLTGWAPHESQPKPLAPGSAKTRLAEALGVAEHSAGESAISGSSRHS